MCCVNDGLLLLLLCCCVGYDLRHKIMSDLKLLYIPLGDTGRKISAAKAISPNESNVSVYRQHAIVCNKLCHEPPRNRARIRCKYTLFVPLCTFPTTRIFVYVHTV